MVPHLQLENLKLAKEVVEKAHAKGTFSRSWKLVLSVKRRESSVKLIESSNQEDANQWLQLSIDFLAAGISGNIHGPYPAKLEGLGMTTCKIDRSSSWIPNRITRWIRYS